MASFHRRNLNATVFDPLLFEDVYQAPVVGQRDPKTTDKAEYGTVWVNNSTDAVFVITSITANSANWENVTGGAGAFATVTTTGAIAAGTTLAAGTTITAGTGIVTTAGDVEAATATKGFICGSGLKVIDGAGSPHASVTAPKGSIYLRTDGSAVNDRVWINTDGSTAWTYITTGG